MEQSVVTGTGGAATLFDDVVAVTSDYLGPASRRFIERQIRNHLHKSPTQLSLRDLPVLIEWSKAALATLTGEQVFIDEYEQRLLALSSGSTKKAGKA